MLWLFLVSILFYAWNISWGNLSFESSAVFYWYRENATKCTSENIWKKCLKCFFSPNFYWKLIGKYLCRYFLLISSYVKTEKWPKIVKSYVNSMPAQKKFLSPQTFYEFFENLSDCFHYPCHNNVYLVLPVADIWHQLKAIHNTTKYVPYLRWSHGQKSNCPVEMNICAFRLTVVRHEQVDFIFTWLLISYCEY